MTLSIDSTGNDEIQGWGFKTILDELESTRLGINNIEYRKFRSYLEHIPSEYRPEDTQSCTVMQRDWNRQDAFYCYSFVGNTLLRWQSDPDTKLYEIKLDDKYEFEEVINGFTYDSRNREEGCIYLFGKTWVELSYTDKDAKHSLEALEVGKEYSCELRRYKNGTKDFEKTELRKILNVHSFLLKSNPECWGVIMKYQEKTP